MKYRQSIETVALAMLVLVANGLVMAVLTMVEAEAGERTAAMPPIVVEPAKSATLPELMTKLRNERLVYVGETHTAYGDHVLQLDVLRAMAAHEGELAVGVE
ncbi:MAG: ChaN family lipoprotein, partial [Sedimenticolaceae bacterium]